MKYLFLIIITAFFSCRSTKNTMLPTAYPAFLKEGHRGARGLVPENTIASMKKALDLGADVVEVDVYITKDGEVLIAHDPFVNRAISTVPGTNELTADDAKKYTWHQMEYADIKKIDVGSKGNPGFPRQTPQPAYMPLLGELIDSVEAYTKQLSRKPAIYNIEIKADPKFDGVYQPDAAVIVKKVMDVVHSKNIGKRFYLQSFDKRQIQEVHKSYPDVITAYLVSRKLSVDAYLAELGYTPEILSPYYKEVTARTVSDCKKHKMRLVPWTVNTAAEVDSLLALGVNGIITDFPDLLLKK
ncbi:MAG: glycerophosphodiester phosphodiesterase [Chitinophagaceae bacterium]|nr:MAG: glycerophosphodiester phosphodiesterase [Chitinophagaceae bacterium]